MSTEKGNHSNVGCCSFTIFPTSGWVAGGGDGGGSAAVNAFLSQILAAAGGGEKMAKKNRKENSLHSEPNERTNERNGAGKESDPTFSGFPGLQTFHRSAQHPACSMRKCILTLHVGLWPPEPGKRCYRLSSSSSSSSLAARLVPCPVVGPSALRQPEAIYREEKASPANGGSSDYERLLPGK